MSDLEGSLKRTWHRGIFRLGDRYVVPFFDENGVEERRDFTSLKEGRIFRRSLRLNESKPEEEWTDASLTGQKPWDYWRVKD